MPPALARALSKALNWIRLWGKPRHRRNVEASRRVLARLAQLPDEARALAYLRKIDPYLFEEVTLSILERRGCVVLRSRSYSGDGGFDGAFYWPGSGRCAVQCKRYSSAISPSHARDFGAALRGRLGLFAHTGRTGEASAEALGSPGVHILSGSDLARCARDPGVDPLALARARKGRSDSRAAAGQSRGGSKPGARRSRRGASRG